MQVSWHVQPEMAPFSNEKTQCSAPYNHVVVKSCNSQFVHGKWHFFFLSPIFLRIQTQLVRLLVGLLVGQLLPSFFILWYDLPTNSLTNYPTNNRISWVWMRRKMGL
jgi:hypothetical protein